MPIADFELGTLYVYAQNRDLPNYLGRKIKVKRKVIWEFFDLAKYLETSELQAVKVEYTPIHTSWAMKVGDFKEAIGYGTPKYLSLDQEVAVVLNDKFHSFGKIKSFGIQDSKLSVANIFAVGVQSYYSNSPYPLERVKPLSALTLVELRSPEVLSALTGIRQFDEVQKIDKEQNGILGYIKELQLNCASLINMCQSIAGPPTAQHIKMAEEMSNRASESGRPFFPMIPGAMSPFQFMQRYR